MEYQNVFMSKLHHTTYITDNLDITIYYMLVKEIYYRYYTIFSNELNIVLRWKYLMFVQAIHFFELAYESHQHSM